MPELDRQCNRGKYAENGQRCPNPGVYRSTAPLTEHTVWCQEHAPHPKYSVLIEAPDVQEF